MLKKSKRGTILVENVIFIILNLIFLTILVVFLLKQGSGAIVLEEVYSKQTAMLIDSAQSGMIIRIDMEKGKNLVEENGIDFNQVLNIQGNLVIVKLSEKGKYTYSFFNDVDVGSYAEKDDKTGDYTGMYILTISEKGESE